MSVLTLVTDDDLGPGAAEQALALGLTPTDINCPICVETISDPFVTTCGHTFCYQCITTQLRHKNTCPSCGGYLTADHIYPNFLLTKILRKAAAAPAPGSASSLADAVSALLADRQATGGPGGGLRPRDIDAVLEALYDAREELERRESSDVLHLLLCFLRHAREHKEQRLAELRGQLACLEADIAAVCMAPPPAGQLLLSPPVQQPGPQEQPTALLAAHPSAPATGPAAVTAAPAAATRPRSALERTAAAAGPSGGAGPALLRTASIQLHTMTPGGLSSVVTVDTGLLQGARRTGHDPVAAFGAAVQHALAVARGTSSVSISASGGGGAVSSVSAGEGEGVSGMECECEVEEGEDEDGVATSDASTGAEAGHAGTPEGASTGGDAVMAEGGSAGTPGRLEVGSRGRVGMGSGEAQPAPGPDVRLSNGSTPVRTMEDVDMLASRTAVGPSGSEPAQAAGHGHGHGLGQGQGLLPSLPLGLSRGMPRCGSADNFDLLAKRWASVGGAAGATTAGAAAAGTAAAGTIAAGTEAAAAAAAPAAPGVQGVAAGDDRSSGGEGGASASALSGGDSSALSGAALAASRGLPQPRPHLPGAAGLMPHGAAAAAHGAAASASALIAATTAAARGGGRQPRARDEDSDDEEMERRERRRGHMAAPPAGTARAGAALAPQAPPHALRQPLHARPELVAPVAGGPMDQGPMGPGQPPEAAVAAAKRRRMMSQFEELEEAYLRMRAARTSLQGNSLGFTVPDAAQPAVSTGTLQSTGAAQPDLHPHLHNAPHPAALAAACDHHHAADVINCQCHGPRASQTSGGADVELSSFGAMLAAATRYSRLEMLAEITRHQITPPATAGSGTAAAAAGAGAGGTAGRSGAGPAGGRGSGPPIISSIEFDCSSDVFAMAGTVPRILLYDYKAVLASGTPASGPAARSAPSSPAPTAVLPCRAKLSCLSFSAATRSHLLAADFEGGVTLWDTQATTQLARYEAHERRVWAVDFCPSPNQHTCFSSGSDDGLVKVWSTQQAAPLAALELRGPVTCLEWHPTRPHLLAVGCAAHTAAVYDMRQAGAGPLYGGMAHPRAVSYVRWLPGAHGPGHTDQLLTASTDSTLRLWSLPGLAPSSSSAVPSFDIAPSAAADPTAAAAGSALPATLLRCFRGHANERHFVGCAAGPHPTGQHVAAGSEAHEVVVHFAGMGGHAMRYSFAGRLPPSERAPGGGSHFVTAVQWRPTPPGADPGQAPSLLAANSAGYCWVLGMAL